MVENNIYYVGIDHGNHLIKSVDCIFENGVERQASKPTFATNTLVYDGEYYKIGERRNSVKVSKTNDDDYYLLTLATLAKECQCGKIPNGADIVLGVGLPLKHFAMQRKMFVRYLMRDERPVIFRYEDVEYSFTIRNVYVFPQCYAAVADKLADMKGEYLIVDIGSWTIDIMTLEDGVPVESKCETFTESLISVIQEIKGKSSEKFGKEIPDRVIMTYINDYNDEFDKKYTNLMDDVLENFANRIVGLLKENGHDTDFANVIYVGGGAHMMGFYAKGGPNIKYITDIKANAKGYEYLAKQMA